MRENNDVLTLQEQITSTLNKKEFISYIESFGDNDFVGFAYSCNDDVLSKFVQFQTKLEPKIIVLARSIKIPLVFSCLCGQGVYLCGILV